MEYFFSASDDAFYDASMRDEYLNAHTWPDDAVTVSTADFATYGLGQPPADHQRGNSADGQPCWVAMELEPADIRRTRAINQLDATADRVRAADRSVGRYLDAEYQLVNQALVDYHAQPDGEVPDAIRSHAAAEGLSVEAAAEQIAEAAAHAEDLLQNVRRIRLTGKAAIRDASDDADFAATARPFVGQMEALAAPASTTG